MSITMATESMFTVIGSSLMDCVCVTQSVLRITSCMLLHILCCDPRQALYCVSVMYQSCERGFLLETAVLAHTSVHAHKDVQVLVSVRSTFRRPKGSMQGRHLSGVTGSLAHMILHPLGCLMVWLASPYFLLAVVCG